MDYERNMDYETIKPDYDETIIFRKFKLEAKIRATKQGDKSVDELYGVMFGLWDQISKLEPLSLRELSDYKELQDLKRLIHFLLALRDEFDPIRKQLLGQYNHPSLEEAVNLLKNEEAKLRSLSRFSNKGKLTVDDKDDGTLPKLSTLSMKAKEKQESDYFSKGMFGNVAKFAAASLAIARASWALSDQFAASECSRSDQESATVRILSYNVCFWDLEMHKRMDALGRLILLHSPDVICFQEVTSDIYSIFSRSKWWNDYKCSLPLEQTRGCSYFCMQLSRLPVKSFNNRPFRNSRMRRELCIADIEVFSKKTFNPLIIATSHLESPTPAPPTYDQMNSEERVVQAKEALNHLQRYPNVIFCGDMNWDEATDGRFPLVEGWFDAWTEIRPREIGWTYDTKSNQMLSANRPLQKRLDRFVCKMEGFRVGDIKMIGTEVIPGVKYWKEKRVRNRMQELELPVFASDHYGLLLEIHSK